MWRRMLYVKFLHKHALFSIDLSAYLAFQCNSRSLENSPWPTHHCATATTRKSTSPTYTSNKSSTIRIAVWPSEAFTVEQGLRPSDGSRNVSIIQIDNSLSSQHICHHSLSRACFTWHSTVHFRTIGNQLSLSIPLADPRDI